MPRKARNKDLYYTEHILLEIFFTLNFLYINLALEQSISSNSKCLHKIMMIDKYINITIIIIKFSYFFGWRNNFYIYTIFKILAF